MDNRLTYQRAEDKKGRNPIVNQYVYYPDGRLKEAAGGGITYRYEYTEQGLLKRKSASEKTLLEYGYDKNRNITSITDGTGKTVRYIYDELNRMTRAEEAEQGTALASFQYTPFGQVEAVAYGNGVRSRYEYEENGAITSLVTVTPEGRVLLNFDYAYDGNGNCTKKSEKRYQNTYAYDQMNRLTEAVYDGRMEQYTYDFTGNRLKKEIEKEQEFYAYNAKNQLIRLEKGAGITDYLYDNQGNLLEEVGRGGKKYTYDALNRLSSVESDTFMQRNRL